MNKMDKNTTVSFKLLKVKTDNKLGKTSVTVFPKLCNCTVLNSSSFGGRCKCPGLNGCWASICLKSLKIKYAQLLIAHTVHYITKKCLILDIYSFLIDSHRITN